MKRDSRTQPPIKESQEHANSKHDQRDELPSPDMDFPEPSSGTGGGEIKGSPSSG